MPVVKYILPKWKPIGIFLPKGLVIRISLDLSGLNSVLF